MCGDGGRALHAICTQNNTTQPQHNKVRTRRFSGATGTTNIGKHWFLNCPRAREREGGYYYYDYLAHVYLHVLATHLFACVDGCAQVDVTERAGADLATQPIFVAHA